MERNRTALLTMAIVVIGIFALPSTMSLFAGQHVWYDLSAGINDVPCEKCHADVVEEMQSDANGAHRNLTCAMCHRTPFNNTYNSLTDHYEPEIATTYASGEGGGSTPGKEAHAGATIECMDCHGINEVKEAGYPDHEDYPEYSADLQTCKKCHWNEISGFDISAGGLGLDVSYDDIGENAAHKKFVLDAINDTTMSGANEACLACHTMIGVKITWTHRRSLEFDIGLDEPATLDSGVHNWTIDNWAVSGTANATVWGYSNGTGVTNYSSTWPGNVNDIHTLE